MFLWTIYLVRDFKEDFNLLTEIKWYALSWLAFSNLILWITIQGSYAQWLSMAQLNRIKTYLVIMRSISACIISSVPPLLETYKEETFFPIPPNRECIESVDMVLHIPVAIDYFYEYLKNKHNPEGVHWFALYIDLRLYDSTCSDEDKDLDEIGEMAIRIFAEYLEDGAEYQVQLDPLVHQRFIEKFNQFDPEQPDYSNCDLIFIEVYAFVLDKLRDYFELFKKSNAFSELEKEIRRKERLYEILVEASLISNQ